MRQLVFFIFFIGLILFVWRRPYLGILVYVIFNIIRLEMLVWGGDQLSRAYAILFGVTLLATILKSKIFKMKILQKPQLLLLIWLYLAITISIWLSQYEVIMANYFATEIIKLVLFCFLIFALVNDEHKIRFFIFTMLMSWALLGIWGIQQHYVGNTRLEGLGGNAIPDSNGVAAMAVLFLPVALDNVFNEKNKGIKFLSFFQTLSIHQNQ